MGQLARTARLGIAIVRDGMGRDPSHPFGRRL